MAQITIKPHEGEVRVSWRGHSVAVSKRALDLIEGTYAPVLYIPRDDADMAFLEKTAHRSHCPYKGDASYFSLHAEDGDVKNAVWSYENPIDEVGAIKDHLAFYPQHVQIEA